MHQLPSAFVHVLHSISQCAKYFSLRNIVKFIVAMFLGDMVKH